MSVADGRARYERAIPHPNGGPSGIFECGAGPVATNSDLTFTTMVDTPDHRYEAEYRGRAEKNVAPLTGSLRWTFGTESGTIPHPCTLQLLRSQSQAHASVR